MRARELIGRYKRARDAARAYKAHMDSMKALSEKVTGESGCKAVALYSENVGRTDQLGLFLAENIGKLEKGRHRRVLTMRLLEERPIDEIAYEMDYSKRNVYRLIDEAVAELDKVLES